MKSINEKIGLKIKALREENSITQEQLAKSITTSKANLCRYEAGKVQIPFQMLLNIANFFNVSIDYLFDRTDIKNYNEVTNFTLKERKIIKAYREMKNRQEAVDILLEVKNEEETVTFTMIESSFTEQK